MPAPGPPRMDELRCSRGPPRPRRTPRPGRRLRRSLSRGRVGRGRSALPRQLSVSPSLRRRLLAHAPIAQAVPISSALGRQTAVGVARPRVEIRRPAGGRGRALAPATAPRSGTMVDGRRANRAPNPLAFDLSCVRSSMMDESIEERASRVLSGVRMDLERRHSARAGGAHSRLVLRLTCATLDLSSAPEVPALGPDQSLSGLLLPVWERSG